MSERLDHVLERLAAAGIDMRQNGEQRWRGECPACGNSDRLTVREGLDGAVWVNCWSATCEPQAILDILSLSWTDLRPADGRSGVGRLRRASEVRIERIEWLFPLRVPCRALTLLAGDPGLGKSSLTWWWATSLSLQGVASVFASAEDGFAHRVIPSLKAMGADLQHVSMFDIVDEDGGRYMELPEDVSQLAETVAAERARLVVIDPLNAHLSTAIDSWKDHGIRRALAPLARMADELGCAVVIVVHLNKQKGGDPLYRPGGSIGNVGAARSLLGFGRDPEDEDDGPRRLLGHLKSNWGRLAPTLAFEVQDAIVLDDQGAPIDTSKLKLLGEVGTAARAAFGHRPQDDRGGDCEEAIAAELADGPQASRTVKTAVMAELGVSEPTVKRAAARMADRGELVVRERGAGLGPGQVVRSTEWQLVISRINPIAKRDPTEGTPGNTGVSGGESFSRITDRNGDPTEPADDPTETQLSLGVNLAKLNGQPTDRERALDQLRRAGG